MLAENLNLGYICNSVDLFINVEMCRRLWSCKKCQNIDVRRRVEQILSRILSLQTLLGKRFGRQLRNSVELDRISNIWHLLLRFLIVIVNCQLRVFCKGVLIRISLFPKKVSMNLLNNLCPYWYKGFLY